MKGTFAKHALAHLAFRLVGHFAKNFWATLLHDFQLSTTFFGPLDLWQVCVNRITDFIGDL